MPNFSASAAPRASGRASEPLRPSILVQPMMSFKSTVASGTLAEPEVASAGAPATYSYLVRVSAHDRLQFFLIFCFEQKQFSENIFMPLAYPAANSVLVQPWIHGAVQIN